MALTREEMSRRFVASCRSWYDIDEGPFSGPLPLQAVCVFHSRQEKYVLSKKARLWGIESNEYVYIFSTPELTPELVRSGVEYALEQALPQVQPHPEHMYSYITAIFLADAAPRPALDAVKKSRFFKSYKHTLHGSSILRTVGVDLGKGLVVTNEHGRESGKFFKKALKE